MDKKYINDDITLLMNEDISVATITIRVREPSDWNADFDTLFGVFTLNGSEDFGFDLKTLKIENNKLQKNDTIFVAFVHAITDSEAKVLFGVKGPMPNPSPNIVGKEITVYRADVSPFDRLD